MSTYRDIKIRRIYAGCYETTNTVPAVWIEKESEGWTYRIGDRVESGYGAGWATLRDVKIVISDCVNMGDAAAEGYRVKIKS